jgi:hypothetical protein
VLHHECIHVGTMIIPFFHLFVLGGKLAWQHSTSWMEAVYTSRANSGITCTTIHSCSVNGVGHLVLAYICTSNAVINIGTADYSRLPRRKRYTSYITSAVTHTGVADYSCRIIRSWGKNRGEHKKTPLVFCVYIFYLLLHPYISSVMRKTQLSKQ